MKVFGVIALLFALAAFGACSRTPDEPTFDNPFDPNGTNPGGGYGLEVTASGLAVTLIWDNVPGIAGYDLYRSDQGPEFAGMALIESGIQPQVGAPKVSYADSTFTAQETNWYRLRGSDEEGLALTPSTPVAIDISVLVAPSDGFASTPTRVIDLDILTGVATTVEVSNLGTFEESELIPVRPGELDGYEGWELATSIYDPELGRFRNVRQNDDLYVHFRAVEGQTVGPADSSVVKVSFTPGMTIERGVRATPGILTMVDVTQQFRIDDVPEQVLVSVVRNVRNAEDTAWVERDSFPGQALGDSIVVDWDPTEEPFVANQIVATLRSDFGFEETAELELQVPTELGDPSIEMVGGTVVTPDTDFIQFLPTGENAGIVYLSEDPAFPNPLEYVWDVRAEAFVIEYPLVDKTLGKRDLYAAFSNPILGEAKVAQLTFFVVEPPARGRR